MPELPEVETVVRDLRPRLIGKRVASVRTSRLLLRRPWQKKWARRLVGQRVKDVRRRGKWIIVDFEAAGHLLVHLGMTGQFTVESARSPVASHTHVVVALGNGKHQLRFRDVRRFGSVEFWPESAAVDALLAGKLGPEPSELPADWHRSFAGSRRCLKAILLDQRVVAGVGNIYADEALFEARLPPTQLGTATTPSEARRLRSALVRVLDRAISARGSSIRDYVDGNGERGAFQNEFRVYGRTGEPCVRCGTAVSCIRLAGRSTHFCPTCQQTID